MEIWKRIHQRVEEARKRAKEEARRQGICDRVGTVVVSREEAEEWREWVKGREAWPGGCPSADRRLKAFGVVLVDTDETPFEL